MDSTTYLVSGKDRSTPNVLQRVHAGRARRFVDLPTGHHPFVSLHDPVVDQIELLLRDVRVWLPPPAGIEGACLVVGGWRVTREQTAGVSRETRAAQCWWVGVLMWRPRG